MSTHWRKVHQPSERELRLLDVLARQAADLIERTGAQEAVAEEFRNTKVLQGLSARLVTEENIQTIYEEILTAALEITRADAGTVQMLHDKTEELVVLATRGFSPETVEYFSRIDASSNTSCGIALRAGERAFLDFDPTSTDVSIRSHVEGGVLSAQSLPLISRSGKPIGMVSTHWREPGHRPSQRELRFLDLLARQAADLIEQRQAQKALRVSEENYRTLFDSIDEGFCTIEVLFDERTRAVDYRFLQVNPSFERQTGIRNAPGKRMREIAPQHEEHWFEIYGRVAQTGEPIRFEREAKELGDRFYDVYAFRVEDPHLRRVGLLFNDITARKRAEVQLQTRNDELERFNKIAVGRELRMIDLKKQINQLLNQQGEPARYALEFEAKDNDAYRK
jgi:PAS domain S-box-containing protein